VKITILPPQEAPKQLTAQHRSKSLGEHFEAFMSVNNIRGFMDELCVEEPIVEEVAAMWLIVVWEVQYQRQVEAMRLYAEQQWLLERKATQEKKMAERAAKRALDTPVLKTAQVAQSMVRGTVAEADSQLFKTPLQQYDEAVKQARASGKMFDIASPKPLRDAEYRARLNELLADSEILISEAEMSDRMKTSPLRKHIVASRDFYSMRAVTPEQAKAIAQAYQESLAPVFVSTFDIQEFLMSSPKSEPTGAYRINPYLK